jgi:hypothetical protein
MIDRDILMYLLCGMIVASGILADCLRASLRGDK